MKRLFGIFLLFLGFFIMGITVDDSIIANSIIKALATLLVIGGIKLQDTNENHLI